jgi:hypothetical protein
MLDAKTPPVPRKPLFNGSTNVRVARHINFATLLATSLEHLQPGILRNKIGSVPLSSPSGVTGHGMDPLSLTASIIAVVQVSHVVLLCCYRLRGKIKGADDEVAHIILEVEDLSATLTDFGDLFDSLNGDGSLLESLSLEALTVEASLKKRELPWEPALATCNTILSEISEKLVPFTKPSLKAKLKWPFESKSIVNKLKLLEKQKGTFQLAVTALQTRITSKTCNQVSEVQDSLLDVHEAVLEGGKRVVGSVDRLRNESKRMAILNWYKTSDPEQNHKVSRAKHEPETAKWIFDDKKFLSWATNPSESLWLHGIPGAGKTILSSTIIDYLQHRHEEERLTRVIYYYFDFGDNKKQTVAGFLQSLVYQLISEEDNLLEAAAALLRNTRASSSLLSTSCWKFFSRRFRGQRRLTS